MSSKIDKEMLNDPDVFVSTSDHVFDFIEHHFRTFVAIVGLGMAIAVVYVTTGYLNSRAEQKAAEALYAPEAELKKADSLIREESAKQVKTIVEGKKEKPAETAPPVENFAKNFAPSIEKLKIQIKAHADTKAALVSALKLSHFLTEHKQFSGALEVLDLATYKPSAQDLLTGFVAMHRGVTLLENGQFDKATSVYESVLSNTAQKPFQPEALLKLALCYELKGDTEKARVTYEKVGHDFPDTEASNTARQYLRLLSIKNHTQG